MKRLRSVFEPAGIEFESEQDQAAHYARVADETVEKLRLFDSAAFERRVQEQLRQIAARSE